VKTVFFAVAVYLFLLTDPAAEAAAYMGGGVTVLVGSDSGHSGTVIRLEAELKAAGFNVELIAVDIKGDPERELNVKAEKSGAGAAILLLKSTGVVRIWIADRVTGKTVIRNVTVPESEEIPDTFIALSCVELLRASFLEVAVPSGRKFGEVKPDSAVKKMISPVEDEPAAEVRQKQSSGRFLLRISPAVSFAGFNAPPMFNIELGAGYRIYRNMQVSFFIQLPVVPSKTEKSENCRP
jgi:hypothetical protein